MYKLNSLMINALQNLGIHYNTRTKSTSTVIFLILESWKLLKNRIIQRHVTSFKRKLLLIC